MFVELWKALRISGSRLRIRSYFSASAMFLLDTALDTHCANGAPMTVYAMFTIH